MSKLLKTVATTVIGLMFLSSGVAAAYDNGTSTIDQKELMCLARNIYFESGSEPEQGKIAVGMVTLNRTQHPNFPDTICGVVKQKTILERPREVRKIREVITGWGPYKRTEQHVETRTVIDRVAVCQFSWVCAITRKIRETDQRWQESLSVALELMTGGHAVYQHRMGDWLYFHNNRVNPRWHNLKRDERIGNHIFYVEKN